MARAIDVDRALVLWRDRFTRLSVDSAFVAGAARTSSACAVSLAGVTSPGAGETDCRMSFASLSIRQIATPIAKVTTAAQTATAPASSYKTPSLVGSRSRLV